MAFGGGDDDVTIKVTLDASQLESLAKNVGEKLKTGLGRDGSEAVGKIKKATDNATSGFSKLGSQILTVNQALGAIERTAGAITGAFSKVDSTLSRALNVEGVTSAFKSLQESVGNIPTEQLEKLRKATQGYISDTQLMQKANQAVLLGLPTAGFDKLAGSAIKLGRAMGLDALSAVDSLTLGVGRQSKLILDNLGIIVNAEQAYKNYAAAHGVLVDSLSDSEKTLAFQEEAFSKIKERADTLAASTNTAATSFEKLKATIGNVIDKTVEAISKNDEIRKSIESLSDTLKRDEEPMTRFFVMLSKQAATAAEGFTVLAELIPSIADDIAHLNLNNGIGGGYDPILSVLLKRANAKREADKLPVVSREDDYGSDVLKALDEASNQIKEKQKAALDIATQTESMITQINNKAAKDLDISSFAGFNETEVKQLQKSFDDLFATMGKGKNSAAVISNGIDTIIKSLGTLSGPKLESLRRIAEKTLDQTKKSLDDAKAADKKATDEAKRNLKARQDDLEKFERQMTQTFNPAKFSEYEVLIKKAFSKPQSKESLVEELVAIKKQAQEAGEAFSEFVDKEVEVQRKGGGNIFGISFEGMNQVLASQIENSISSALSLVNQALTSGVGREDAVAIGQQIGSTIGATIGAAVTGGSAAGASAGSFIGSIIGQVDGTIVASFGKDSSGTKARKAVDKYFADLFNGDRLTVVVEGELKKISDLQFQGNENLTAGITPELDTIGMAFEEMLGVTEEYSGRIASVLLGNIGDSLSNLQALVMATGKSFEDFGNVMFEAFFKGSISLEELVNGLEELEKIFEIGIPDKLGDIDGAIERFKNALEGAESPRVLFNTLRGIGQEAKEAGKSLEDIAPKLAAAFGIGAENVTKFIEAMRKSGLDSIDAFLAAGNEKLASFALNVKEIAAGGDPTHTAVTAPQNSITSAPNFTPTPSAPTKKASSGLSDAQKRLQDLQQQTIKLVTASDSYAKIMDKVTAKTINAKNAGNQINELYREQFKVLDKVQKAQDAYDKALSSGKKGEALGKLAKQLNEAELAADKFAKSLEKSTRVDLSGITALIRDANTLGTVMGTIGITSEDSMDVLVQGFLRGKLSLSEFNEKMAQTKDLLGQGIPGAVGAVAQAFSNLQKDGTKGGIFSVDDFKDIFAEEEELFKQVSGPERQKQLKILTDSFNEARDALQSGLGNGASADEVKKLNNNFQDAQKSLSDFNSTEVKAGLEDLRAELKKTFDPQQVDILFKGMAESGLSTFDEFKNAGNDVVAGILGSLQNLGFQFAETTQSNTKNLLDEYDKANKAANDGKDILDLQLKTLGDILTQAKGLPSTYSDSNEALSKLQSPFTKLSSDFDTLLQQMTTFKTTSYDKKIILNVELKPKDSQVQSILDLYVNNGGGSSNANTGSPGLTQKQQTRLTFLQRKVEKGTASKGDKAEIKRLQGMAA